MTSSELVSHDRTATGPKELGLGSFPLSNWDQEGHLVFGAKGPPSQVSVHSSKGHRSFKKLHRLIRIIDDSFARPNSNLTSLKYPSLKGYEAPASSPCPLRFSSQN